MEFWLPMSPCLGHQLPTDGPFLGHFWIFCCRPLNKNLQSVSKKKMKRWKLTRMPAAQVYNISLKSLSLQQINMSRFVQIQVKISKKDGRRGLKISSLNNDWTFVQTSTILSKILANCFGTSEMQEQKHYLLITHKPPISVGHTSVFATSVESLDELYGRDASKPARTGQQELREMTAFKNRSAGAVKGAPNLEDALQGWSVMDTRLLVGWSLDGRWYIVVFL